MKIHQYGILCAPITSQEAALAALRDGEPDAAAMRREYQGRRNFIVGAFNELWACPATSRAERSTLFPDIRPSGLSSTEFLPAFAASEKKVAVVPGSRRSARAARATCAPVMRRACRRSRRR